jgi:phage-related protein
MPLSSIYNVSAYNSNATYALNDICIYNSKYYYSLKWSNTSNPTIASAWGGYKSYSTPYGAAVAAPECIWVPNYASEIENKPMVMKIQFGDGYEQRVPDGINGSLIKLSLIFEGRSEREVKAIVHFFNARKGVEPFFFHHVFPYNYDSTSQNYPKRFMVDEFSTRSVFYDNYTVNAKLSETVNI